MYCTFRNAKYLRTKVLWFDDGQEPAIGTNIGGGFVRIERKDTDWAEREPPNVGAMGKRTRHTAYNLPTHLPNAPRLDSMGFAQFDTAKEIKEFEASCTDLGMPKYEFDV